MLNVQNPGPKSKPSNQIVLFLGERDTHPTTLVLKTFVQTSLFSQDVPFLPSDVAIPALFIKTVTYKREHISARVLSWEAHPGSDLIPSFEDFFLEFYDFIEVPDISWDSQDVGCTDDRGNLYGGLLQGLFIYIRQGELHPEPKLEERDRKDKRVGENDPLGPFLGQETLDRAIRNVYTLCKFPCCGSTNSAAGACDNCDTALVQDRVSGLV